MNTKTLLFKVANGLTLSADEQALVDAIKGTSAPKAKASTPKKGKVGSADKFDRKEYERIAKACGCYGKHGVWKAARPTVYAVMDGRMSESDAKKAVKAIASRNGWQLNKG